MLHTHTHTRACTLEFLFRRFADFGFDFGAACEREGKRRGGGDVLKIITIKTFYSCVACVVVAVVAWSACCIQYFDLDAPLCVASASAGRVITIIAL